MTNREQAAIAAAAWSFFTKNWTKSKRGTIGVLALTTGTSFQTRALHACSAKESPEGMLDQFALDTIRKIKQSKESQRDSMHDVVLAIKMIAIIPISVVAVAVIAHLIALGIDPDYE